MIKDPKTFYFDFDWPKDVDENLKHETEFTIKNYKSLTENKIKDEMEKYCPNISMERVFNVLNLSQSLDLRSLNKRVEKYKKQYENKKLNIIAPTWSDEFELSDGSYSVSHIQDYIGYIIKT